MGTSSAFKTRAANVFAFDRNSHRLLHRGVICLAIWATPAAFAAEPPASPAETVNDPQQGRAGRAALSFSADVDARKQYGTAAAEGLGFAFLLNQFNRHYLGDDYKSNTSTIRRNLRHSWVVDDDPFATNQLGHPYQGTIYYGFARSNGLNFWESMGYSVAGSALWEIAGENTLPSRNDQIATGFGGAFLGESLFRLSNLMIEQGNGPTKLWREVAAALISPPTGFNRNFVRNRHSSIYATGDPAFYSRFQLGFSGTAQNDQGTSTAKLHRNEILTDYSIDYGLPGKKGYTYDRPFDYFQLQATASTANGFENLMTRGLLIGRPFSEGKEARGVLGLYGSYEYIAPQIFRISSTALSLGTTGEWRVSDGIALNGTALLGVGYAAVGTTRGNATEEDYHYGLAPQALLAARMIFAESASLDITAREYFVTNVAAASHGGRDNIVRVDASFTYRIQKRHGLTIKYLGNRRDAYFPGLGNRTQARGTIGLFYTFLGQDGFGNADWQ